MPLDRNSASSASSAVNRVRTFSVRPDFVFPKLRLAVFVDGCFWHGCPRHFTRPKSRQAFWDAKILGNKQRDRLVNRTLRKAGWRVLRIWEHELRRREERRLVRRLEENLGRSMEMVSRAKKLPGRPKLRS